MVYAGTEPAAVFKSTDRGATFELERALWDHPHRTEWGAGFGGQAFHTLLPHPEDTSSVTVALSTGGVYQTHDGGASWEPRNHGIRAEFLPEGQQYPEFGQCVHKVTRHPSNPRRLFAQNHGGVYRSDDEGETWVSIADGLPSDFGFPIVVHPHEPDTVFVFPIGDGDSRFPPEGKPRVWRSRDAGDSWEPLERGPARRVLRRGDARRDVHRHPRPGRPLLRRPQRHRLGLGRLRRDLAPGGRQPARRDGGAGRRRLSEPQNRAVARQVRRPPPLADLDVEDRVVGGVAGEGLVGDQHAGAEEGRAATGCRRGSADPFSPVPGSPGSAAISCPSRVELDELVGEARVRDVHVAGPADPEAVGQVAGARGPQRPQPARARRAPDRQPVELAVGGHATRRSRSTAA